jgi:signal transduction histidine kinase
VSLRARMLLLLAAVVIGASLASVAAVRFAAESRFRTFVSTGDTARAEELALLLAAFHDLRGSWDGVQDLFGVMGPVGRAGMMGMMREGRRAGPLRPGESPLGTRSRVVLVDLDGTVVADSSRELLGTRRPAGDAATTGGANAAAAGIPVIGRDGIVGTLFVGTMLEAGLAASDAAFLDSVTRAIVAATVLAAAAALVAGLFALRRLTRPVAELTRAAERAGAGDLDVRVAVHGRDEIARLAGSFNRMTEALQDQEAGRRRMIADSAHELRTPVSLIQGTVEAMLDGVYPPDRSTLEGLHEETLRLSRLVEDLNELSLLESGTLALAIEDADLVEIARSEAGRFAARAAEHGVSIAVESAAGLPRAAVDRLRIGQVIANLLGNALRHTPRGGAIAVRLEAPDGGRLRLAVEDSGPGIPEGERARVFERYYRVDGARAAAEGGRGLGLAIAAGIVKAHGGTMYAGRSAVLGGAMVAMEMPAARLDAAAPVPL